VRRLRHVLGAADEDGVAVAEQQLLRALHDGLEARAAEAVHRDGGRRDGQAGLEADVARAVDGVGARLHHVADDDVGDRVGRDLRLREGGPGGVDAEVRGGDPLERALHGAEGGALRGEDDDRLRKLGHGFAPVFCTPI
jgi:hypothetical protein